MSADGILRPCLAGAMLSPTWLHFGRGGHHESATSATGPGAPRKTGTRYHHRAGRRCGTPDWSDDQDGLARGLGPAYPAPLDATRAQLGVDSSDLAGLYRHGRRPPKGVSRNLPQGYAPYPEPPDRTGYRAAGF